MSKLSKLFPVPPAPIRPNDISTLDYGHVAKISGTSLDFSVNTANAPVAQPFFDFHSYISSNITAGGSDAKTFDPRDCVIRQINFFDTTTGISAVANIPYGEGRGNGYDWLNTSYCGRIATNVNSITPIDNTDTITLAFPDHGLPLALEGGMIFVSAGDYGTSGILTPRGSWSIVSVDDATNITINATLVAWNNQMGYGAPQNAYFPSLVFEQAGGNNLSQYTLEIHWSFDREAPTFLESIYSDD